MESQFLLSGKKEELEISQLTIGVRLMKGRIQSIR